jgi:hypothetical protein
MQALEIDLEKDLAPIWRLRRRLEAKANKLKKCPHPLREFFHTRSIPNAKIAAVMRVTASTVSYWFSGKYPPPPDREKALWEIRDTILSWEAQYGRRFGT